MNENQFAFEFDLEKGRHARDAGMAQVEDNARPWPEQALELVAILAARGVPGERFAGERIRRWVSSSIGEPHDPHAWGALINTALHRKIIVDTGQRVQMAKPSSHARRTPVYRWGEP